VTQLGWQGRGQGCPNDGNKIKSNNDKLLTRLGIPGYGHLFSYVGCWITPEKKFNTEKKSLPINAFSCSPKKGRNYLLYLIQYTAIDGDK
jgi:hypothetical protein